MTQEWPLSGTVDLDSMDYDPETGTYSTECRCGGSYSLAESEMEETAVDTLLLHVQSGHQSSLPTDGRASRGTGGTRGKQKGKQEELIYTRCAILASL